MIVIREYLNCFSIIFNIILKYKLTRCNVSNVGVHYPQGGGVGCQVQGFKHILLMVNQVLLPMINFWKDFNDI